tara:strand:+ start:1517 stop:2659 length:1143 start_codon:yes stop_codon:yes gene_type:complete
MKIDLKSIKKKKLFYTLIALPLPFIVGFIALFMGASSTTVIALISLGLILVVIPSVLVSFWEYREIKDAEDQFPHFLSDLSQSSSAGMTLPQSIDVAATSSYGKLTKYIQKLNVWLSWNQTFPKAWARFTKLLGKSVLIRRVNTIILEAVHSGGDVKKTLGALAEDVALIKDMESERKSIMQQQIIIMYIIFFVFIAVIVALYKILSPILYIQQIGAFSGISLQGGGPQLSIEYFRNLFFLMAMVEAICAGLLAGEISEERLVAGIKHVLIMVSVTVFVFFIFIFPSELSVEVSIFPTEVPIDEKITILGQAFSEGAPAAGASVSISEPSGDIISLFTDNAGEFRYSWEPPQADGEYLLKISVEFEGDIKSFSRTVIVNE